MNLTTERLYMRPYKPGDEDFLQSMLSHPKMMQYIGDGKVKDQEGMKAFLHWIYDTYEQNPDLGLHVILRKEDDAKIGHAGIVPQRIDHVEELELGYWIDQRYWKNGYATEAAAALVNIAFQQFHLDKLIALIQPGNEGSISVANRAGMEFEKEIQLEAKKVLVYSMSKRFR
ncbi:GNAT family N-acetyltransferase [Halobacillus sp. B23F22_1]|uniref:GNAT family N-acetyltransferase n=1 Tax=Halobacillus sp. B23F22_1 TaxID=3459514 RepID=UPI00373F468F